MLAVERDVARLVGQGWRTGAIAAELGVHKSQVSRIKARLRTQLESSDPVPTRAADLAVQEARRDPPRLRTVPRETTPEPPPQSIRDLLSDALSTVREILRDRLAHPGVRLQAAGLVLGQTSGEPAEQHVDRVPQWIEEHLAHEMSFRAEQGAA